MLKQGLIRESNSPYNSPTWVVSKKTDASGEENSWLLEQIKTKDWIECRNALMRIFNQLDKPILFKADRDSAFSSLALKTWLESEEI